MQSMKSFPWTLKAQQLHKHNPDESIPITLPYPSALYQWRILNWFKYTWMCNKTRFPLVSKNTQKHFTSLFSPYSKAWNPKRRNGAPDAGCRHQDQNFADTVGLDSLSNLTQMQPTKTASMVRTLMPRGSLWPSTAVTYYSLQRDQLLSPLEKSEPEYYLLLRGMGDAHSQ